MSSGYGEKELDLGFLKYFIPLIAGGIAAMFLLDYYGIYQISYITDIPLETKMIYLAYGVIAMSLIIFLYLFRKGDNNKSRW
jgi:hypothetical protein